MVQAVRTILIDKEFTFQYGAIGMDDVRTITIQVQIFTFQYGAIGMKFQRQ